MLANVLLDPVAQENMVSFYQYWESMRDALTKAFGTSGERYGAMLAAIALALGDTPQLGALDRAL